MPSYYNESGTMITLSDGTETLNAYDPNDCVFQYAIEGYDTRGRPIYSPNPNYNGPALYPSLFHTVVVGEENFRKDFRAGHEDGIPDKLQNTIFTYCTFNGADLSGKEFTQCAFIRCAFNDATLRGTSFIDCTINGCRITRTNLTGAKLKNCILDNTYLSRSVLDACTYIGGCGFRWCNIDILQADHSKWNDTLFTNSTIQSSSFTYAVMSNIQFTDTSITGVRFDYASLTNITSNIDYLERRSRYDPNITTHRAHQHKSCFLLVVSGRLVTCRGCGEKIRESQLKHKGIKLCKECVRQKDYSERNDVYVGKSGSLPSFGIEFEMENTEDDDEVQSPLDLIQHGWIRTHDASVGDEYKSPIYLDMRSFMHVLPVLDECAGYVTSSCGTHLHVGMDTESKRRLANNYSRVLGALVSRMVDSPKETIAFWGRYFVGYARNSPNDHYNWIRIGDSHGPTVEFRLAKFHTSAQYLRIMKFCRALIRYLDRELNRPRSTESYSQIDAFVLALYDKAVQGIDTDVHGRYEPWVYNERADSDYDHPGWYSDNEDEDFDYNEDD